MDTLKEARRVANNTHRQRADVATRRAALAQLRSLDVVQVVDVEAECLMPPVPLWEVLTAEDGARSYLLSDWRRRSGVWKHHEKRFSADGLELDAIGHAVPHGRLLVVPPVGREEARQLRMSLWARWHTALTAVNAQQRAEEAETRTRWLAALSPGLRALLTDGEREEEPDMAMAEATSFDAVTARSIRDVVGAVCLRRIRALEEAGLPGAEIEAAIQAAVRAEAALRDVPTTDREVAWMLAHLPPDVVRRALRMADALRERYVGGERLLPPPEGA